VCNPTHPFTADNRLVQCLQSNVCPYCAHATARTSPIRNSWVLGLSGMLSPKTALPLRGSSPHVTHCSSGQAHSSSQTASRSVQAFFYGSQMICCTMQCLWGRKPPKLPLPLVNSYPAREEASHGHRQHAQKFRKDCACGSGETDRHTDVLIMILRNRSYCTKGCTLELS